MKLFSFKIVRVLPMFVGLGALATLPSCQTTEEGAVIGAIAGGLAGAAIGHNNEHSHRYRSNNRYYYKDRGHGYRPDYRYYERRRVPYRRDNRYYRSYDPYYRY